MISEVDIQDHHPRVEILGIGQGQDQKVEVQNRGHALGQHPDQNLKRRKGQNLQNQRKMILVVEKAQRKRRKDPDLG